MMLLMIIAVLIVLGLCFGSFVNAFVWRLHEQETIKEKQATAKPTKSQSAKLKDLSIVNGRSMCTDCHHTLAWYDLIPVLSWLSVGGKCRYCRKQISWQYPIVELTTAALFVTSYVYWPQPLDAQGIFDLAIFLVTLIAFMAMTVYDFRWMILPNIIVYPLIVLTGVQRLVDTFVFGDTVLTLLLSVAASLIGGGIFYVLYQISDGNWIGGGDVKLGFSLGFLVATPLQAMLLLLIASLIGLLGALPAVFHGRFKRNLQIPFGPCLMAACFILVLFGQQIVRWYMNLLVA